MTRFEENSAIGCDMLFLLSSVVVDDPMFDALTGKHFWHDWKTDNPVKPKVRNQKKWDVRGKLRKVNQFCCISTNNKYF